ncbi:hypothetical protein HK103_001918 [Boothiomyces macroporosus]|uniref:Brix domain-containing protein n=1 Tax=Boothiomyces macroporosus TaxID=261099 RepID=A0AAD5Y9N5_9FUNG|nr:hypothetical protein HK103_001918 [Boothiomyces macroporosus]
MGKKRERKGNKIKDFLMIAGQLMVTHLLVLSKSSNGGVNLRIGRIPRGPTITFHVESYVLAKDVLHLQKRPKSPGTEFLASPLVVLNGFGDKSSKKVVLMATMLQNMFPSIKVSTMKLSEARRIILFNLNPETNMVEMRHYRITIKTLGLSKSVKTLIHANVPDLHNYKDISDFIMRGAFASESDIEDGPEASVVLPRQSESDKRAIRLFEIGPRLNLKLIKIQDGLCSGEVIHHEFITKSKEEIKQLNLKKQKEKDEKNRRRAEQERNVKAKAAKLAANQKKDAEGDEEENDAEEEQEEMEYDEEDFSDLMEEDDE